MKCSSCLLSAAATLLVVAPAMPFCQVPQPRLVCAEYFASELVIEASLVQTSIVSDKDDPEGISAHIYTLRVDEVLRGKAVDKIRVYEGNDSGRATFDWVPERQYLLFLLGSDKDGWRLDGCGNSGPLNRAKTALSKIDSIKTARDGGTIQGVVSSQALSDFVSGVHVEAQGATGRYEATTNEKGEFQIRVPTGRYSVRAIETGRSFGEADFSYEDPRQLQIEPGGCAQVQLAELRATAR
jgi:hypothetical protein